MTDSKALRNWIESHGLKLKAIANKINITSFSLQKKIDNITEFKASEIMVFTNDFGMSSADRDKIFFAENVGK